MTVDIIPTETRESPRLLEVREALIHAARVPYNNAAHIFDAAGLPSDPRMGGSCLKKLGQLRESLPLDSSPETHVVTSTISKTTHYAMLTQIDGVPYYLDPFLWQREPMPLVTNNEGASFPTSKTLLDTWELRQEPNGEDSIFDVSFVQTDINPAKILITHKFSGQLDYLPSPSILPITPDLPSFIMQIPDYEGQLFYKMWFAKELEDIADIWVTDGRTGERARVARNTPQPKLRERTIASIENVLGVSEQDICDYYNRARVIELELGKLLSNPNVGPYEHPNESGI